MTLRLPPLRILVLLAALPWAGCADEEPALPQGPPVIEREAFIATYVDLRDAALREPRAEISDSARQAVLERHGVTEEELLRFAEVRGTDLVFMRDVWAEVERRMEARRIPRDSLGG